MSHADHPKISLERLIEYVPPSNDSINRFVQEFCRRVATDKGEQKPSTEFVAGFAAFVRVVVKIQTRSHNQLVKGVRNVSKS